MSDVSVDLWEEWIAYASNPDHSPPPPDLASIPHSQFYYHLAGKVLEEAWKNKALFSCLDPQQGIVDLQFGLTLGIGEICKQVMSEVGSIERAFFEYPQLIEQMEKLRVKWEKALFDFLARYAQDSSLIIDTFFMGKDPGLIVEGLAPFAWFFQDRRAILHFSNGQRLLYKNRPLYAEKLYSQFLSQLNKEGLKPDLKGCEIISKESYGWQEFIVHLPVANQEEVQLYYKRLGALLRIWELLCLSDCGRNNIIANGAYPVLIDGETFFSFYIPSEMGSWDQFRTMEGGVMSHGALPRGQYYPEKKGLALNPGAFYLGEKSVFHFSYLWGELCYKDEGTYIPFDENGSLYKAQDFADFILDGYTQTYRWLQQRAYLFLDNPIIRTMSSQPTRRIVRDMFSYNVLYEKMHAPLYFRTKNLNVDLGNFIKNEEPEKMLFILEQEHESLEKEISPVFYEKGDTINLEGHDCQKRAFGSCKKPWERMEELIEKSSEEDLRLQQKMIKFAFYCPTVAEKMNAWHPYCKTNFTAESIATFIEDSAIANPAGNWTWFTLAMGYHHDHWVYSRAGNLLGSGSLGIALFFAALAKTTNSPHWWSAFEKTMKSVIPTFRILGQNMMTLVDKGYSLGAWQGLLGIIYGTHIISEFSSDETLQVIILHFLKNIPYELIEEMEDLSLDSGIAGIGVILHKLKDKYNLDPHLDKIALRLRKKLKEEERPWKHGLQGPYGLLYALSILSPTPIEIDQKQVRESFPLQEALTPQDLTIGTGLAGTALALLATGIELEEELKSALLARLMEPKCVAADGLISGNAGRSLAIYRLTKGQVKFPLTLDFLKLPIFGFAHGMAGVGYTLLQLEGSDLPDIIF